MSDFGKPTQGSPTRRQFVADDIVRCRLIKPSQRVEEVEAALGPPDNTETYRGRLTLLYWLGPERDALIRIDPEYLGIETNSGSVSAVLFIQG